MRGVQKGVSEKEGINIVDSDSLTRKIEFIHLNLLYVFFASNMKKTSDDDAHWIMSRPAEFSHKAFMSSRGATGTATCHETRKPLVVSHSSIQLRLVNLFCRFYFQKTINKGIFKLFSSLCTSLSANRLFGLSRDDNGVYMNFWFTCCWAFSGDAGLSARWEVVKREEKLLS